MSKPAVTVHIAEAGPPLLGSGKSTPGHMWYELHDGKGGKPQSYGATDL